MNEEDDWSLWLDGPLPAAPSALPPRPTAPGWSWREACDGRLLELVDPGGATRAHVALEPIRKKAKSRTVAVEVLMGGRIIFQRFGVTMDRAREFFLTFSDPPVPPPPLERWE